MENGRLLDQSILQNGGVSSLTLGGKCPAMFEKELVEIPSETEKRGYRFLEELILIKIFLPGGDMIARVPTEKDKEDYKNQWEAFQRNEEPKHDGTALEVTGLLNKAHVANLNSLHIFTIEQLVECPDSTIQKIGPGAYQMRDNAKAYLERSRTSVPLAELKEENSLLKERLALLEKHMTEKDPSFITDAAENTKDKKKKS